MFKLFALKRELETQLADTQQKKATMDRSIQIAKDHAHNNVTSPAALIASFATGAAAGWYLTRPKARIAAEEDAEQQPEKKAPSVLSGTMKNVLGLAASMVAAEVTSQTMTLVKGALLEKAQTQHQPDSESPDTENEARQRDL